MQIEDLQIIQAVAKFQSISAAAIHLDLSPATTSAAVKRVEKQLGSQLFERTTRKLRLSKAGENYLPKCEQALKLLMQAEENLKGEQNLIDGELRLAISSDFGRNLVVPWLDEFMQQHPKIRIRLNVSDSLSDFYRDPIDMALRYGSPSEASLYGFKILDVPGLLCAAPSYLNKHGTPAHPEDLKQHNGLFYQLYDMTHDTWEFQQGKQKFKIKMKGNRTANDGDLVRRWCVAGKGLAVKSCLDMSEDLLSGKVMNVMPDYRPQQTELWLIFPSRQTITPAARLLRDFLKQKTQKIIEKLTAKGIL